ncbi:uncharacterized protein AAG666_009141 isoform 1-T5 [Megaptera novaeangliae]
MQKLLITFRNDEQKIGDRPLLKCFGNCSSFTFLLWQGSAEKSPKMLSTVKDSHWLKNNGSLVWCQNRKQCSKPISFRIPPEGSLSSGHFESLLELPLWLILLPTLGALHQSQIGSLAFHANVSVPSVRRTCLVNSRPHKVPLGLLSALGEAPGMLPGLPERFYKDFAQPSQGQRPGHS